jgi:CubicO group peptidase (beta-lactamase class C family)
VALDADPGAAYVYSDLGFITLGLLVETVTGVPLDAFLTARVFGPLGLSDTGFRPDASELPRIAPTEIDTIFRMRHVHGEVHDENAFAIGGVSGSAGLFSSASDLAGFVEAMMTGERFPIRREVVDLFTRQQSEGSSRALGWDTPSGRSSAGDYFTEDSFGHTGFTGTSIWVDKELDLAVVLLTNRVNPTRAGSGIAQLRRDVADAAALAVTDRTVARRGR